MVNLIWITPEAENLIAYIGRVSNPENQNNPSIEKLIAYLIKNNHWSPFEMVNMCVEIESTRDIARQILRHRSFSFQEFSQRYADVSLLPKAQLRECRLQDTKNRQNSISTDNESLKLDWDNMQKLAYAATIDMYKEALSKGIAKEQARSLLPEGLTSSRMYMNGNLRSWLHYIAIRCEAGTQKEHRIIAEKIKSIIFENFPHIEKALNG